MLRSATFNDRIRLEDGKQGWGVPYWHINLTPIGAFSFAFLGVPVHGTLTGNFAKMFYTFVPIGVSRPPQKLNFLNLKWI